MNRTLLDTRPGKEGSAIAAIRGPMFICAHGTELESLTPYACHKLAEIYHYPEKFYMHNGELRSMKFVPVQHAEARR